VRPIGEAFAQVTREVGGDHRTADPTRLERALLLVQRADDAPLVVVEHRAVDRVGDVIERVLGRRTRIDDRVEVVPVLDAHRAVALRHRGTLARTIIRRRIWKKVRLTQFSHGGGCGCKIAPGLLSEILSRASQGLVPPELMVGTETSDDAAVYRLNGEQALVATTDFFTPIVDDPRDFGRIAATNALSDIYAMGGRPILALALVGMPIDKLPPDVIGQVLAGGAEVCREAGIPIAGGHSIDCWSRSTGSSRSASCIRSA
jgi:selenide,water dikinase